MAGLHSREPCHATTFPALALEAKLDSGVLKITAPKPPEAQSEKKKIDVVAV